MRQSLSVGSVSMSGEYADAVQCSGTTAFVERVERALDHAVFVMTRDITIPQSIKARLVDIRNPERRKERRRSHILGSYLEIFAECVKAGATLKDALAPIYAFLHEAVRTTAQKLHIIKAIEMGTVAEFKANIAQLRVTDGDVTLDDVRAYRDALVEQQVNTEVEIAVCDRIESEIEHKESV
jgi:hypothetical protein